MQAGILGPRDASVFAERSREHLARVTERASRAPLDAIRPGGGNLAGVAAARRGPIVELIREAESLQFLPEGAEIPAMANESVETLMQEVDAFIEMADAFAEVAQMAARMLELRPRSRVLGRRWRDVWTCVASHARHTQRFALEIVRRSQSHIAAAQGRAATVAALERAGGATPSRLAAARGLEAMQRQSVDSGHDQMTLDEINAEIHAVRSLRRA